MARQIVELNLKSKSDSISDERIPLQNKKTNQTSAYKLEDLFPILQDGSTTSGSKSLGSALGVSTLTPLFVGGGFGNTITGNEKNTLIFKGIRSNDTVIEIKNETLSSDLTKTNLVIDFNQSLLDLSACSNSSSGFLSTVNLTSNVGSTILPVANGGTGVAALADKAVLITQDSGTDTVAAAAMSTNGQILIGGSSGPAVATITAGTNMTVTNADGAITLASSIGTISADLDMQNYDIDLGTGWLSGDGTHEGVNIDSSGKVFIGSATPTGYFTSDLNVNSSISLGATNGSTAQSITLKPCTSGSSPTFTISGSAASGTGNAGGAVVVNAGAGDTNGNGGNLEVRAGLKAGSGTDGSVLIRTGSSGTITTAVTVDNSQNATFAAGIIQRGDAGIVLHQNTPATTDDGTAVVSAANVLTGIVTCTPTADRSKATDTAANYISTLGLAADDDAFDFSVINLATDGTSFVTITAGTGVTLVGAAIISAQDAAEDAFTSGVGRFRIRRTGSAAVSVYRIA
jgi:hypothetical protein